MNQQKKTPRSMYVLAALCEFCLGGDAYTTEDALYELCRRNREDLRYDVFRADLAEQIRLGKIHREGTRLYTTKTWRYEERAAAELSKLLALPSLPSHTLDGAVVVGEYELCDEQRAAVELALSNRVAVILGGAGCGKTTLVRAIVERAEVNGSFVLCAPTGKAARNLTERTKLQARTVHSALGLHPDEDFLAPVEWEYIGLVIVDEASMVTLEMLAGILCRTKPDCHVVLLGDGAQLPSVGAGNVIADLRALGFPVMALETNHRLVKGADALTNNVVRFKELRHASELQTDDSFCFLPMGEVQAQKALVDEAARRYLAGESVQVLSPYREKTGLSAWMLNQLIRDRVNPAVPEQKQFRVGRTIFRSGDRVLIGMNDRDRDVVNGDVGRLIILIATRDALAFSILMDDGRTAAWDGDEAVEASKKLLLAYAITVHKSQGSEYDTVLFPVTQSMQTMLSRNLFYTAISRARKQVTLYGSSQALSSAMQRELPSRKSMLVSKTRMLMELPA